MAIFQEENENSNYEEQTRNDKKKWRDEHNKQVEGNSIT